jgi:hypothetical protein
VNNNLTVTLSQQRTHAFYQQCRTNLTSLLSLLSDLATKSFRTDLLKLTVIIATVNLTSLAALVALLSLTAATRLGLEGSTTSTDTLVSNSIDNVSNRSTRCASTLSSRNLLTTGSTADGGPTSFQHPLKSLGAVRADLELAVANLKDDLHGVPFVVVA